MANPNIIPRRLYKYRTFSNLTLDMLIEDHLYFADPSTFNDPLDTNPSLKIDVDSNVLENILEHLVEERIRAEMSAAAKSLRYNGPRTLEHIAKHSRDSVARMLSDIRYNANNPEYEVEDSLQFLLGQYVESELLRRYNRGVFSLGERSDCPLMWSHYGDQHRGVCVGYSVPLDAAGDLHKISYRGSRLVPASDVAAMVNGDQAARERVDKAVLTKKAKDWGYEKEWRLIGERGIRDSPLEMEEIVFGMRCDTAVKYAVVKALEPGSRALKFYDIRRQTGTFRLIKRLVDLDELNHSLPRRARDVLEAFEDLDDLRGVP